MYPHGLVGNCRISALIRLEGSIEWLCLPSPDSEPALGRLLDPGGGHCSVKLSGSSYHSGQHYIENTNVLVTEIEDNCGQKIRITDFCPRHEKGGRIFNPPALLRAIEPLSDHPEVLVHIRPVSGWNKAQATALNVRTSPGSYPLEGTPFKIDRKIWLMIAWGDDPLEGWSDSLCESSLQQTIEWWLRWIKHCSIPTLYQKEVLRSALALKLHCDEDSGAILASPTTSLPEEPGGTRNWDYRYCWLRDSAFALTAFHNLGHFDEMEGFLRFLLQIVRERLTGRDELAPVYRMDRTLPLPEVSQPSWAGFLSAQPVRVGNQAAEHVQNDVYGEMLLALAPIFLDERFRHLRTREHEDLLIHLGRICASRIGQADAGIWEIRNSWKEHAFTQLMSWAGLDRICRIQRLGYLHGVDFTADCDRALARIIAATHDGAVRNGPSDPSFDAALALLPVLRFPDPRISHATLTGLLSELQAEGPGRGFFYRYRRSDDFGRPKSAFLLCSFWMAHALCTLGRRDEGRSILERALLAANHLGLFSEHFDFERGLQLGNFPQAYSHVGLINAAFAASPPWSEIL